MQSPSRVAVIGNQAFSLINFRKAMMQEMIAHGHVVFALAPGFDADQQAELLAASIKPVAYGLSRTGLNPLRDGRDAVALSRTLKTLNLDAVLSFGIKPVIYGTLASRFAGVPKRFALIAGLGYAFMEDGSARQRTVHLAAKTLYRLALSQADAVFMQNPDDADDLVAMGIVGRDKIVPVNGTGVDLEAWRVAPPVIAPPTFVLAARLILEKGTPEFVEAARRVRAQHPQARFILLGGLDANPSAIAEPTVRRWVAEGIVEWPGHVPVRPWLSEASVFVLPSYYREGVPRSIQEAMAMGRPIITTDAPGCRETVIEGQNGFLVAPRDVDALVAAMVRFIEQPELILAMGAASRALAEQKFDVRQVNARIIETMGL